MYWPWAQRDVLWIVPLGYVLVFAVPVFLLALGSGLSPRIVRRHWVFGAWSALGIFAVLILYARAESWALALLAAGVSVQLARVYHQRERRVTRVIRRGALLLTAFFAVFGAGGAIVRAWSAQRALASLSASSDAPNILWIILDTVRASSLSLYGAARPTTPRLAAWAKRGVTFDYAFATSSWTLPSHSSMFTGVYPSQHSADWTSPLDGTHKTLAESLRERGYATGGFVGNLIATGYETGLARGFITYDDSRRTLTEVLASTSITQGESIITALTRWRRDRWISGALRALAAFDFRPASWTLIHDYKSAADVIRPLMRWQSSLGGRPFFAFLNLFDAHSPDRTPQPYYSMFNGGARRQDIYDGALRYLDDQVGDLLDELERRGVLRKTIVIISADHGELNSEHNLYGHGNALYSYLLRVPLVILGGDSSAAGRRIATEVSLRDIAATSLDLAHQRDDEIPGESLAELWRSDSGQVSRVIAEVSQGTRENPANPTAKGDMVAVVDDSLHLIKWGNGFFEVFAYRTDTAEATNLAPAVANLPAYFALLYGLALQSSENR